MKHADDGTFQSLTLEETIASFYERAIPEPMSGCWIWTGGQTVLGYGLLRSGGRVVLAHRFSYELHHGPLGGLCALHRCDLPPCVSPAHLFAGTPADNSADMAAKGRWGNRPAIGVAHHNAKLNPEAVRAILSAAKAGGSRYALAEKYGVSYPTIEGVIHRRVWRHVREEVAP
jgi:hypothetical protein